MVKVGPGDLDNDAPGLSIQRATSLNDEENAPEQRRNAKLASCLSWLPCFTPKRIVTVTNSTPVPVVAIINDDPERLRCVSTGLSAGGGGPASLAVKTNAKWEASGSAPSQKITIGPERESEVRVKSTVVYVTLCVKSEEPNVWRVVMDNRMVNDFSCLNIMPHHVAESATLNTVGSLP